MASGLTRRTLLKLMAGGALSGASVTAYAGVIEPGFRLRVQHYGFTPTNWIAGLQLRIAALTDLHVGEGYMSLNRLNHIIDVTNSLKPDIILLLGDYQKRNYRYPMDVPARDVAQSLARLSAPFGVHAVLGNHDWWNDPLAVQRRLPISDMGTELLAAGITLYQNQAIRFYKNGVPFWVAGLDDQLAFPGYGGADNLPAMLARIKGKAPVILLAHEPDIFPKIPDRITITFCGHTHGGQFRFFGYSPIVPSLYGNRFAYGHVEEDNRHLIVSGGLGTGRIHMRLGIPPEIVLVSVGS